MYITGVLFVCEKGLTFESITKVRLVHIHTPLTWLGNWITVAAAARTP